MEALTPIDEDPCEDLADEDQPITMIPRIMHTAPSPTVENPVSTITSSSTNTNNATEQKPNHQQLTNSNNKTTATTTNNNINNGGSSGNAVNGNTGDKEVSQIESVL